MCASEIRIPFVGAKDLVRDFELGEYIIRAVDQVDLMIEESEYVAIIGSSGAGKTTLLHTLGGLDKATKGQVYLSRINITPMSEESLTTFRIFNVGIIFQNYNLISSFTALENIMFPMQLGGTGYTQCEQRGKELLKMIGLADREDHLPAQLSAGEQQRVAIARALANDPPIILADEPTANLDKKNAIFIAEMFEKLRQDGKTVIVATHDDRLIGLAHRIIEMDNGKIVKDTRIRIVEHPPSPEPMVEEDQEELSK
jgi:putative ABC transport system ATP-binding protein